jgi:hypothetical protein
MGVGRHGLDQRNGGRQDEGWALQSRKTELLSLRTSRLSTHTGSAPAAVVAMTVVAAARATPTRRLVEKRMAVMAYPRLLSVSACVGMVGWVE